MGARLFRCFMHLQWVSLLFAISPLQFLFFLQRLDDGWPESEKDVFQAALRMVVVKDSR